MRRRQPVQPPTTAGVPTDLAAGPRTDLWADPKDACALTSARANWRAARAAWRREHGITSWHDMPPELRDRAPFHHVPGRK